MIARSVNGGRNLKALILAVGIGWLGAAQAAQAHMPASQQQILCSASSAIVGTIVDARSHDCRLRSSDRYCYNMAIVGITIHIDEVLSPDEGALAVGDNVHVATRINNGLPMRIGDKSFPMNQTSGGSIGLPATGKGVTDAEAQQALVGKKFLFAISPIGKAMNPIEEPLFAESYSMDQEAWVREQWPSTECIRWRRH